MAVARSEIFQQPDMNVRNEVLPDGTIHNKIVIRRNSISLDEDDASNKIMSEVLETFEGPAHVDQNFEEVEDILPDGTRVRRKVSLSRMVHVIKTHHESFDEGSGSERVTEDYELEEVIPGTVSAFDAGVDSDYEDELTKKGGIVKLAESKPVLEQETYEIWDTQPDGTKVKRKVVASQMVHTITARRESFDKESGTVMSGSYSVTEVIPNTASTFVATDSDDEREVQVQVDGGDQAQLGGKE